MIGLMDTRQLLYFRAVVDNGSFTHAAESLDMTQPSLSLSIRKLEKELNAQLVEEYLPAVPLTHSPPAIVVSQNVEGLVSSPLTGEQFDTVSIKERPGAAGPRPGRAR